jgi:subtilase family serine protease
MRISKVAVAAGAALTALGALTAAAPAAATAGTVPGAAERAACPRARPGQLRCLTLYAPQLAVNRAIAEKAAGKRVPAWSTVPKGWGAKDIESAYKLPLTKGAGQTVAIVDAYSTPHLASDMSFYRKQYGLPPCTTASGCLRIVNQEGKASPLPKADPLGWGVEETLDVSMVSAACPLCKIIVVEGRAPTYGSLAAAENTAVRLGANIVSNSYDARESGFTQAYAKDYRHPGHVIVASAGDDGFTAALFPANLANVTAAGGTNLVKAKNARGWTETVWNNRLGASGSGCSAYVNKPAWQHDPHCPGRTVGDVSAVATNIALYDSSVSQQLGGPWLNIGGTSASSPLIAAVYGLAGNAATIRPGDEYAHAGALFDVTKGNNDWINATSGASCGYDYLCVAKKGYDAPTGLGTPDGIGAF